MIKVYHNSEFLQYGIDSTLEALKKGTFECVAEVETDSLDEAYSATNNIDSPWHLNTNVKAIRRENRSTSVGDLLKRGNTFFVVDSLGFRELTREDECTLTFRLEGGSMKELTKSNIVGEAVIDHPTPEEILFLGKMKAKGYTIGIQFSEEGKPFGDSLAFKTTKDLSSFMWDNPKLKMVWMRIL